MQRAATWVRMGDGCAVLFADWGSFVIVPEETDWVRSERGLFTLQSRPVHFVIRFVGRTLCCMHRHALCMIYVEYLAASARATFGTSEAST